MNLKHDAAVHGDPVRSFVDLCLRPTSEPNATIENHQLHSWFGAFCQQHGYQGWGMNKFINHLKTILPHHYVARRRAGATVDPQRRMIPAHWRGIAGLAEVFVNVAQTANSSDYSQRYLSPQHLEPQWDCVKSKCSEGGLMAFQSNDGPDGSPPLVDGSILDSTNGLSPDPNETTLLQEFQSSGSGRSPRSGLLGSISNEVEEFEPEKLDLENKQDVRVAIMSLISPTPKTGRFWSSFVRNGQGDKETRRQGEKTMGYKLRSFPLSPQPLVPLSYQHKYASYPNRIGWGSPTLDQAIQQNAAFANIPLGELDLRRYSIASVPGLEQTAIGKFTAWQQSFIAQVPGLSNVPFSQFPMPQTSNKISVAVTDMVWSAVEHGDPKVPLSQFISGSVNKKGMTVPVKCAAGKPCPYIELSDLMGASGSNHGKRWVSGLVQKVKGGFGPLAAVNNGWEPAGKLVFGSAFKVVLTDTNESIGRANFALYMRACGHISFYGKSCTPYFIGGIPWMTTREKGLVIVASTAKPTVNIDSKYTARIAQIEAENQPSPTPLNSSPDSTEVDNTRSRISHKLTKTSYFSLLQRSYLLL